jgi:hypothetical protein
VLAIGMPPGRPGGGGGGGGLILPGSDGFPGGGGGGGGDGPPQPRPGGGFGPVASAPREGPLYQPFRPPASYKETAMLPKQELLNRLTSAWRARAREREMCFVARACFRGFACEPARRHSLAAAARCAASAPHAGAARAPSPRPRPRTAPPTTHARTHTHTHTRARTPSG